MSMYLLMSNILKLVDKLTNGTPSKSSQSTILSNPLIYLIWCSSLSIRAWVSSKVGVGTAIGGEETFVSPWKTKGVGCGFDWLVKGGGGGIDSNCVPSWIRTYRAYYASITWLKLVIASWIEAMAVVSWSIVTCLESISDHSETLINLSPTLILEVESNLNGITLLQGMEGWGKIWFLKSSEKVEMH